MTVALLAGRIERQFQTNLERHALARELVIKVERLRGCFAGTNFLPSRTAEIAAAWNDLPNTITDPLPISMKSTWMSPPVPPPTPTGLYFDQDDAIYSVHVDDTNLPTPTRCPIPSSEWWTSRCSQLDQLLGLQNGEEPSSKSTESSDPGSPTTEPVGFWKEVKQWLLDYRVRGTEAFIQTLIAFAVQSTATAKMAAQIVRAIIVKLHSKEGHRLENSIRVTALATFKNRWSSENQTIEWASIQTTAFASQYDLHLAGFIGSLFTFNVASVRDVHTCLSLLLEGDKSPDRLCAMHALLAQANDRLCKRRYVKSLLRFQNRVVTRDETGEHLWAKAPYSKAILGDIVAIIERWTVTQSIKRGQSELSSSRIAQPPNRAVGPRLRNTPVAPPQEQ